MNALDFTFSGRRLVALASGALLDPAEGVLCVSDLHLAKSERIARREGRMLPPYETQETLDRLAGDLEATGAGTVICLGDSFDDLDAAASLGPAERDRLNGLQAGRRWIWIEGNHDPGPVEFGGTYLAEFHCNGLTYRHIAGEAPAEISGHYHPKLRLPGTGAARRAFLFDRTRLVMPAYGTYTGGLSARDAAIGRLFPFGGQAILCASRPILCPLPAKGLAFP